MVDGENANACTQPTKTTSCFIHKKRIVVCFPPAKNLGIQWWQGSKYYFDSHKKLQTLQHISKAGPLNHCFLTSQVWKLSNEPQCHGFLSLLNFPPTSQGPVFLAEQSDFTLSSAPSESKPLSDNPVPTPCQIDNKNRGPCGLCAHVHIHIFHTGHKKYRQDKKSWEGKEQKENKDYRKKWIVKSFISGLKIWLKHIFE